MQKNTFVCVFSVFFFKAVRQLVISVTFESDDDFTLQWTKKKQLKNYISKEVIINWQFHPRDYFQNR